MPNDARLWFVIKLLGITALLFVLFNWLLPLLGLPVLVVVISLFFAILIWGLWTLRRIAQGGGG